MRNARKFLFHDTYFKPLLRKTYNIKAINTDKSIDYEHYASPKRRGKKKEAWNTRKVNKEDEAPTNYSPTLKRIFSTRNMRRGNEIRWKTIIVEGGIPREFLTSIV